MSEFVLANANILTMDPSQPCVRSVLVKDGKIAALSRDTDFSRSHDPASTFIDCRGHTVLPGFIDAHCHIAAYADSLLTLDLSPTRTRSIAEIQCVIGAVAQTLGPDAWINGRGYDEFHLAERRHPNRWDLDAVSPHNPVVLKHRSGHALLLNTAALTRVGIGPETGDPPAGLIERDVLTGEPTGLLFGEHPCLRNIHRKGRTQDLARGIALANRMLLAQGITSLHDTSPRNDADRLQLLRSWRQEGLLQPRVHMAMGWEEFLHGGPVSGATMTGHGHVTVAGVKIVMHEVTGSVTPDQADLDQMLNQIHRSGGQAILHAVEQGAIESGCTAIERAIALSPGRDARHRIEHCSICPPALAKRLAVAGIIVVTQPAFLHFSGDRYLETVVADEQSALYPLTTLLRAGVTVAGSSDFPVTPPAAMLGIGSAVTRQTSSGRYVRPEQGTTLFEALTLFTRNAATAMFAENSIGSIRPGQFGDFAILGDDPTKVPLLAIKDVQIEMTIIAGKVVWEARR